MKKIMFINNQLGGGGAERVLIMLANYLSKLDEYNVNILSLHRAEKKYDIDDDVKVNELDLNGCSTLSIIKIIRKEIKKERPDIIISFEYHVNMKVILAAIGYSKIKLIISERNDPSHKGGRFPLKQARNILYKKANCLVCQTPDAKEYFPKKIQKHSVIIPNPIKSDLPLPWKEERNKEIVNFCRLDPQKNLKLLIDAFGDFLNEFNDYSLTIYGDGSLGEELVNYIMSKGLEEKVTIHPAVSDIHERIKKAAMFVSSSDYEGLSNSMLEAMALGIPTICTDCPCGGARMIITNEINGILVPVNDKGEMIKAMKKIAGDKDFADKISEQEIKIRHQLAPEIIVEKWKEVIE